MSRTSCDLLSLNNLVIFFTYLVFSTIVSDTMATTYYVSPGGNDANTGLSPAAAWQTIARVNLAGILPGDEILFEGGSTFTSAAGLSFSVGRCGTAANPVRISSFGTGRATLNVTADHGFLAYECAGFEITDLNFVGAGRLVNSFGGIVFFSNTGLPTLITHDYIRIHRVEVSGFNLGGIKIQATEIYVGSGGALTTPGYADIEITFAEVHDNGDFGIEILGDWLVGTNIYPNRDILIQYCTAYDNPGQNGLTTEHTGSGIVVGNAENVLIEFCLAYNNGADNFANSGGPVGIWMWDTKDGIIQSCESYENKTSSTKDGGGFDLDGGCVNCVIQYCYSHDNDGAGYLLAEFGASRDMVNNTIRYNISQNDGRKNDYAGIQFWRDQFTPGTGLLDETYVYNNVVYIGASANPGAIPAGIRSISGSITNAKIANNVFIVNDGMRMVDKQFATDIDFVGNAYYSLNNVYEYNEAGTVYNSLVNWRASGQETLTGNPVGIEVDPQLVNPGNGGIIGNPLNLPTLNDYTLQAGSPLEDAGLDLNALFGINVGGRDFYGTTVPINTVHDIGAYESAGPTLSAGAVQFTGERLDNGNVYLHYDLGVEELPEGLLLERSLDGESFTLLANPEVATRVGHRYDYQAPSSAIYYRIGLVKIDGSISYSNILEIQPYQQNEQIQVFPNPAQDEVSVFLRTPHTYQSLEVELLDMTGKHVFRTTVSVNAEKVQFELPRSLANGVYTLQVITAQSRLKQQILIDR